MKINRKLKKIGDLVNANSLILDIGCDHALLDIYLIKEKKMKRVIASDIGEGPLNCARENIKKEKLEDKIELRLGDGLDTYTPDIDTIIVSGMGGRTIIGMFKYKIKLIKNVDEIIVSPNNYQEDVRRFFTSIGFMIEDEYLVKDGKIIYQEDVRRFFTSIGFMIEDEYLIKDGKIIYQIIKFKRGKKRYNKKSYFFGPILLEKQDKLFNEYYTRELKSREILTNVLPKNYRLKKFLVKREIKLIKDTIII